VRLAKAVAAEANHFRAVQLPFNIGMPEAFTEPTQHLDDRDVAFLTAAQELDLFVTTSVPLMQRQLTTGLPPIVSALFPGFETDAQRAIQFVRSTPGIHVSLVGMSDVAHVEENLAVATRPLAPKEEYLRLFVEE
jgi:aryl-alcohol dehydrogenase-like predicted oxidoreductase